MSGVFSSGRRTGQRAAAIQAASTAEGVAEERRQFDLSRADLAPTVAVGQTALANQAALTGLDGAVAEQAALDAFIESPGQQFLRERGERAILRNASALGNLGGGNVRRELVEHGIGVASGQLSERQNRLASLSGSGQVASRDLGALGSASAGRVSGLLRDSGTALAANANARDARSVANTGRLVSAGIGAGAAALSGTSVGAGALFGLLSDRRLKKNITKLSYLPSGLAVYVWDWISDNITQPSIGVLADEARGMFPQSVAVGPDGYLRVNYKELG